MGRVAEDQVSAGWSSLSKSIRMTDSVLTCTL